MVLYSHMFVETKKRTVYKTISWRVIAVFNSWLVLTLVDNPQDNLGNALIMNLTGFLIFFVFERVWNTIKYGRVMKKQDE